ncbi:MAG: ABC transporter substrate-binding protein [Chloroflexi bacterium]|nr:ABC transporter substrate-binding protein [Chloroflexota bacterium]
MRKVSLFLLVATVIALLLAACAPAAAPPPAPTAKPAAAPTPAAAPPKAAATAPAPAAPSPSPKPAADQPKYGGTLRLATQGDPPSFDIQRDSSNVTAYPIGPAYSGLLRSDEATPDKIVPDLAESWEVSADGTVYTFRLRKGVKWHDGKPFTSADAVYSMERLKKIQSHVNFILEAAAARFEAPDEFTLKVTLDHATSGFMSAMALMWAAMGPKHVIEAKGDLRRDVVGTGAYKFKSFSPGVATELVKNPDYFTKGRPYLDGMTVYPIRDAASRFAGLRTRQIDLLGPLAVSHAQAKALKEGAPEARVELVKYGYWFLFYMPVDKAPWGDARVRRAVALAVDHQNALKLVDDGIGDVWTATPPALGGVPPDELMKTPGYRQPKDADIAEGKKLLAEAGLANGFETRILYRMGRQYETLATFMRDQLAKIGVRAEIYTMEDAAYYDLYYSKKWHSLATRSPLEFGDPDALLPQYYRTGGMRNFSNVSDPELDKLVDEQSRSTDPARRKQLVYQADKRILEMAYNVVTHWSSFDIAYWPHVKNFTAPLSLYNGFKFIETWLAK